MGHTAEEKIKILYEDSLLEIRELTNRLESIKAVITSLPGLADKEMKRAGAQTITDLSAHVGEIANRISTDAALVERHKAFYLACSLLAGSAVVFVCLGVYLGSRDWGSVVLCGASMIAGVAAGMTLLVYLNGIEHSVHSPARARTTPELPAKQISEAQFAQAASRLGKQTSSRTLAACKEVLVGGESCVDASHKYDVLPAQITRLANELRSIIK